MSLQHELDVLDLQIAIEGPDLTLLLCRDIVAEALAHYPKAHPLTQLLAQTATGEIAPEVAAVQIVTQPVLREALLTFGESNQFGDVTTGDVAGRDVVKITINVLQRDDHAT